MVFKVSFSSEEIARLFLTYRRSMSNYQKIKDRLFGAEAKKEFKKAVRGRLFFMGSLTFICMASSVFSLFANHMYSLGAIWIIWAAFNSVLGFSLYLMYKDSYWVMQKNEIFFEDFEKIASLCDELDEFETAWEASPFFEKYLNK